MIGRGRGDRAQSKIDYRPPYDWAAALTHLAARAIEGVEWVRDDTYGRSVRVEGRSGTVEVAHDRAAQHLTVTAHFLRAAEVLPRLVERARRAFDAEADVAAIGAHLGEDPLLAPRVAARPGLRPLRGWDGFELGVRAVLGQQVTVAAARKLAGRLVEICGGPLDPTLRTPMTAEAPLRTFPSADDLLRTDLGALGMPAVRRRAIVALAQAAVSDPRLFEAEGSLKDKVARLRAIAGVGEWTAQYIALRAVGEPDAFPATDRGLLRGAAALVGVEVGADDLLRRAERWRPWRAYAAQHLWMADVESRRDR